MSSGRVGKRSIASTAAATTTATAASSRVVGQGRAGGANGDASTGINIKGEAGPVTVFVSNLDRGASVEVVKVIIKFQNAYHQYLII